MPLAAGTLAVLDAIVLNVMAEAWNWSLDELFWPTAAAIIVSGTLMWHVDWSRFRRRSAPTKHP